MRRDLFRRLDADCSGGISIDELSQGLTEQGYNVSTHEVERLMARLDLDADGNILFDEFAAGLLDWKDVSLIRFLTKDCIVWGLTLV